MDVWRTRAAEDGEYKAQVYESNDNVEFHFNVTNINWANLGYFSFLTAKWR